VAVWTYVGSGIRLFGCLCAFLKRTEVIEDTRNPGILWVRDSPLYKIEPMSFPIKTCVVCGEEFELKPGKPGFANHCPECSAPDADTGTDKPSLTAEERKAESERNAERRKVIRDLLYRKDR
jgi:hypothetical protein